jgi:ribose transport system ATP-binding protein
MKETTVDNILQIDSVRKSFFDVPVLKDVSFPLQRRHILGLIGENGAGKSTLMNILGGNLQADSGMIQMDGQPLLSKSPRDAAGRGIAFVHQELNLFLNLSIAENLFISRFPVYAALPVIHTKRMNERAQSLLAAVGLNLPPNVLVGSLSPGERQLVEIAKSLNVDAKLLILDEPTSSLTSREARRLFSLIEDLRARGISMIYISHVLPDVLRLCDDVCVLRDGEVVTYGPKSEFSTSGMISLMTGQNLEELFPVRHTSPRDEPALEVRGLSQSGVIRDCTFTLKRGEVLGLFGLMGSGRTELARMIFGIDDFEEGEVLLEGAPVKRQGHKANIRRGLAFVTEDRREEGLFQESSVEDNIAQVAISSFSSSILIDRSHLNIAVKEKGRAVGLSDDALRMRDVKGLSGGNQQKVVLARWFLAGPKVLILDEPTRGIDVGAKHEIYDLINRFAADGGSTLLIASELEELIGLCDRILVMRNGELCDEVTRACFDEERILTSAFGGRNVQ